jgi:hypothetical protein
MYSRFAEQLRVTTVAVKTISVRILQIKKFGANDKGKMANNLFFLKQSILYRGSVN